MSLIKGTASRVKSSSNKSVCDIMSVLSLIIFNCSSFLSSIFLVYLKVLHFCLLLSLY